MTQYNNCNNLNIVKLLIIIKILQQSYCNESINIKFKKNSTNIKHKNNLDLNNLSVKMSAEDKINTECIPPIEEINIKDDKKNIPLIKKINTEFDTKCVSPIQEVNAIKIPIKPEIDIEDEIKSSKNKYEINNNTPANDKCEIPENVNTYHNENFISTLPIFIPKKNIDIPIESTFKLNITTLDINNMKNHIYLTNSKVLPMYYS